MQRKTIMASLLAALMKCSLAAQAFSFLAVAAAPADEALQNPADTGSAKSEAISPAELEKRFKSLSGTCSEDILIFADGKALCGLLVDMPPLTDEATNAQIDISEISAVAFEPGDDNPKVHYVLRDGGTLIKQFAADSFRFSVEYLENGGEQRVQVFYISPYDIRYIIISPRLPQSAPGIHAARHHPQDGAPFKEDKALSAASLARDGAELAANWYDVNAHSLLVDAIAAAVLPAYAIEAAHDLSFSKQGIISYYAELGEPRLPGGVHYASQPFDVYQFASEDASPLAAANGCRYGLICECKPLFSVHESFETFLGVAFDEVQAGIHDTNMLASAEAEVFTKESIWDDRLLYHMAAADFNVNLDEEESEDIEDDDLSGIRFVTSNGDMRDQRGNQIAFSTEGCHALPHNYQSMNGCEWKEWPPVKSTACHEFAGDSLSRAQAQGQPGHELAYVLLSDVIDKTQENEQQALESLLSEKRHNQSMAGNSPAAAGQWQQISSGSTIYIASYPVTNQDYLRFVEATHHPAPAHWTNGRFAKNEAHAPVVNIAYEDAAAYAAWAGDRLPTYDELVRASGSLALVASEFKEWTSTHSVVDSDCFKVYRQSNPELLLQPGKYAAPNIGFRCVKDVDEP